MRIVVDRRSRSGSTKLFARECDELLDRCLERANVQSERLNWILVFKCFNFLNVFLRDTDNNGDFPFLPSSFYALLITTESTFRLFPGYILLRQQHPQQLFFSSSFPFLSRHVSRIYLSYLSHPVYTLGHTRSRIHARTDPTSTRHHHHHHHFRFYHKLIITIVIIINGGLSDGEIAASRR